MFEHGAISLSQIGYVTRDLDRAIDRLVRIFDHAEVDRRNELELEIALEGSAVVNVGRISAKGATLKIIEPVSGAVSLWRDHLPTPGVLVAHHHLTLVANTQDQYDDLLRVYREEGRNIVITGCNPGLAKFAYVDTVAEFGHYLELALPTLTADNRVSRNPLHPFG